MNLRAYKALVNELDEKVKKLEKGREILQECYNFCNDFLEKKKLISQYYKHVKEHKPKEASLREQQLLELKAKGTEIQWLEEYYDIE